MNVATCPICAGPMFVLPSEAAREACVSCSSKVGVCLAPGCGRNLREGKEARWRFCGQHFDAAYACAARRCPERAAADSATRCCVVHEVRLGRSTPSAAYARSRGMR